jgi:hypothetical protein
MYVLYACLVISASLFLHELAVRAKIILAAARGAVGRLQVHRRHVAESVYQSATADELFLRIWLEMRRRGVNRQHDDSGFFHACEHLSDVCKKLDGEGSAPISSWGRFTISQRTDRECAMTNIELKRFPLGSGTIESACKNVIAGCMKRGGMRWPAIGADGNGADRLFFDQPSIRG